MLLLIIISLTQRAQALLANLAAEIMLGLTSAGAVFNLVVEELGDEDQVCEDVEHHCDYLREEHGKKNHNLV